MQLCCNSRFYVTEVEKHFVRAFFIKLFGFMLHLKCIKHCRKLGHFNLFSKSHKNQINKIIYLFM